MKVVKNYLWNVSYQIFVILVPMITLPYISRVLGPRGVGINSYTNSIAQYFVLCGLVGTTLYGSRQVAFQRDYKNRASQSFWEIMIFRTTTILLSLGAYCIFIVCFGGYKYYLFLQGILIIANLFDVSWFFMGQENFKVTVLRNITVKVVTLMLIFVFVRSRSDTGMYIIIVALSTLLGNITLFRYLKNYIKQPDWKHINVRQHFAPSFALFIPQIAVSLYVVLNKTMLGQFVGVNYAGFYDSSDKILRIILAVVTGTGTVLLPHIANQFANGQIQKLRDTFKISLDFVQLISIPMTFGLAAISNKFVLLFLGSNFKEVGNLLFIECIAGLFIALDTAIGQQYLLPTNRNKEYTKSVIFGSVVNVILNVPLIVLFQASGAMLSTVISEIAVTCMMLWQIRTQFSVAKLFEDTYKFLLAGIIMFVVVKLLDNFLGMSWIAVLTEIMVGALIYFLTSIALKPKILSYVISRLI